MSEGVVVREAKPLVVEGNVDVQVDGAVLVEDFVAAERAGVSEEVEGVQVLPRCACPLQVDLLLQQWTIVRDVFGDLLVTARDVLNELKLIGDELGLVIIFVVVVQRVLEVVYPFR